MPANVTNSSPGYYAGFLGSSYFIAQIFCRYRSVISIVSFMLTTAQLLLWMAVRYSRSLFLRTRADNSLDRLGRRPVILFGLCGSTLSILMLGISPNIIWAIGWRFANGMLNGATEPRPLLTSAGNVGVVKTYMAEITDETNQV